VGVGTTFCFSIKVSLGEQAARETPLSLSGVIALESNQPRYKILVVDDHSKNRQLLIKLLKPLGFEVKEACNGQEGVTMWKTWQPHLIWMDMKMPVMDGYEATKYIKGTTGGNETVIIAITASVLEEEKAIVHKSGCDDFVRKPFQQSTIFETMAKHLGVRYIYSQKPREPDSKSNWRLTAESFQGMPSQWLDQLEQASIDLDDELVVSLIKKIPSEKTDLAKTLTHLVSSFRIDQIQTIIEQLKAK
jgi:Amt family ammonium transporter